ncbi:MAG: hypothetical protein ACTSRZ_20205 [Promethearchaeota archaeon]
MYYCSHCEKSVIVIAISMGAIDDNAVNDMIKSYEKEGNIVLINPPPFPPYKCPICYSELIEK